MPATQRLLPEAIVDELKSRLKSWIDDDSDGVLSDVGDRRQRARSAVEGRVGAVKEAIRV